MDREQRRLRSRGTRMRSVVPPHATAGPEEIYGSNRMRLREPPDVTRACQNALSSQCEG